MTKKKPRPKGSPMSVEDRIASYAKQRQGNLTPKQLKRLRKKENHEHASE